MRQTVLQGGEPRSGHETYYNVTQLYRVSTVNILGVKNGYISGVKSGYISGVKSTYGYISEQ